MYTYKAQTAQDVSRYLTLAERANDAEKRLSLYLRKERKRLIQRVAKQQGINAYNYISVYRQLLHRYDLALLEYAKQSLLHQIHF